MHWDFGDDNSKTYLYTPHARNHYLYSGTYNISLIVTHLAKGIFTKANTTLTLFPTVDWLDIIVEKFSIGIKAQIKNIESYNATDVKWNIEVEWPRIFPLITKVAGNDTIENLEQNKPKNITGSNFFITFGLCRIIITIIPENLAIVSKSYNAFKIGPLYLVNPNEI